MFGVDSAVGLFWFKFVIFFFKQKTAYEWRISDWSSDVCSSDLLIRTERFGTIPNPGHRVKTSNQADATNQPSHDLPAAEQRRSERQGSHRPASCAKRLPDPRVQRGTNGHDPARGRRSEEHTSALQSLMRTSYAVFGLKKQTKIVTTHTNT